MTRIARYGLLTSVSLASLSLPFSASWATPPSSPQPPAAFGPGVYNLKSGVRVATFNASLNRNAAGQMLTDLQSGSNAQIKAVAEIIQRLNPDILLINEFDFDSTGQAVDLLRNNYLRRSQNGAIPIDFPHAFVAPSNTGIPSGFDLDNNGSVGGGNDAFGFGNFPGQFGMLVLSKFPIVDDQVRTFQNFLWKDMPGALLPDDINTPSPADWYSPAELGVFRLSSKSHWDIPVSVNGTIIHVLASHPTPPVFDGPEDRNGKRNFDEIRFWADYVDANAAVSSYIYDDAGEFGGLPTGRHFVIMGDQNSDPLDGDSIDGSAQLLLDHPRINVSLTPSSEGAVQQSQLQGGANLQHLSDPKFDTADFADGAPGNLRADYVLPSRSLRLSAAGVFWPRNDQPLFNLVGVFPFPSSDHRPVWVDIALAGSTLPNGVAAGEVGKLGASLWTHTTVPGWVRFEYGLSPSFGFGTRREFVFASAFIDPVKVRTGVLLPGRLYHYRATDSAGSVAIGRFRTPPFDWHADSVRFGVSGDWRGELGPYPSVRNAPGSNLDFFISLGDTIYADYESPMLPGVAQAMTEQEYRLKHVEVYGERLGLNTLGDLRGSTQVLATIDDHEVVNDFAGGAPPASDPFFSGFPGAYINETTPYDRGLTAFIDHNPLVDRRYGNTGDPRTAFKRDLYRVSRFGRNAAVFVLDARSFRDEELPGVANPFDPAEVGAFLAASFDPSRTMLGRPQINRLKAGLLAAKFGGVVWKFIIVPEPIQNLGVVGASDRFEGYAAERTEILQFIDQQNIDNVVFIAADIHGTLVNNLTYQTSPVGPQIATNAFEITTGAVAFDAPFGPTVVGLAVQLGVLSQAQYQQYLALPTPFKEQLLFGLLNNLIVTSGYDPIGLDGSPIQATLAEGGWSATHTYGWTEFNIDATSSELEVTTWGIAPYSEIELLADPNSVVNRVPSVISRFRVTPQN